MMKLNFNTNYYRITPIHYVMKCECVVGLLLSHICTKKKVSVSFVAFNKNVTTLTWVYECLNFLTC